MINPERIDRYSNLLTGGQNISLKDEIAHVVETILEAQVVPVKCDVLVSFLIGNYDNDTAAHSFNTGKEARNLGTYLLDSSGYRNKDKIDLDKLEIAGIFHDIGKVCIPLEILNNKSELTESELALIKDHPKYSFEILKKFYTDHEILMAVLAHHEKDDGSGYPNHLKKDEIPVLAQIIAVTDVYDALTSTRPYREKMAPVDAIQLMKTMNGHFSNDIFEVFLDSKKSLISPAQSPPGSDRIQSLPAL